MVPPKKHLLRHQPANAQIGLMEGNTFCTTLQPRLFTMDLNVVEHKVFYTEVGAGVGVEARAWCCRVSASPSLCAFREGSGNDAGNQPWPGPGLCAGVLPLDLVEGRPGTGEVQHSVGGLGSLEPCQPSRGPGPGSGLGPSCFLESRLLAAVLSV